MAEIQPFALTVSDLCFCHWPVAAGALARSVPDGLTVDTAEGTAWLTAVPATVTGVAAFGVDLASPAETLTVQTPIRGPDGQRGHYCFAVLADSPFATATAMPATETLLRRGRHTRDRTDSRTRRTVQMDGQQLLTVAYSAETDEVNPAPPDSLPSFLLERRRYFAAGPLGSRLSVSVGRDPWALAPVAADVTAQWSSVLSLPEPVGDPLCQCSPEIELTVDPPKPVW